MEFAHVLVVVCYFFVYGAYLFIQLLHFFVGAHTGKIRSVCIANGSKAKVVDMFFQCSLFRVRALNQEQDQVATVRAMRGVPTGTLKTDRIVRL